MGPLTSFLPSSGWMGAKNVAILFVWQDFLYRNAMPNSTRARTAFYIVRISRGTEFNVPFQSKQNAEHTHFTLPYSSPLQLSK